jgi:hypothetical protein
VRRGSEKRKGGGHGGDGAAPCYKGVWQGGSWGVQWSGATWREKERGVLVARGEGGGVGGRDA